MGASTATTSSRRAQLRPLTGLRFLAALHVLLFHAYGSLSGATLFQLPYPLTNWFQSGYVGVSLFFILSGFILAYNYLDNDLAQPSARRSFWVSRLARVYPIYLLGLVVAAPKFIHGMLGAGNTESATSAAISSASVLTLTQAWSPATALQWNPPGWSLSAEAFFYLLFPILALRMRHLNQPGSRRVLLLCWIIALLPPTLYYLLTPGSQAWASLVKFNPLIRLPEFIAGICLGRLFLIQSLHAPRAPTTPIFKPIHIAGIIIAALLFQDLVPKLYVHNALMVPLFAWLILSLAQTNRGQDHLGRFLATPALILLGEASYALYILHIPIKGLMTFGAERLFNIATPMAGSLFFLAYLAVTIAASIMAFKFVEVPARRWIRKRFSQPAVPTPTTGNACITNPGGERAVPSS